MNQTRNFRTRPFVRLIIDKGLSYVLIILIITLGISLARNISNINNSEKVISDQEARVEKARKEKKELEERLEYTKSQEYIEKQLRDKLGLAKEGEIVVVLPPPQVLRRLAPKRTETEEIIPDPNWRKWVKLFI